MFLGAEGLLLVVTSCLEQRTYLGQLSLLNLTDVLVFIGSLKQNIS